MLKNNIHEKDFIIEIHNNSYKNFKNSFIKNFKNHISSLDKYNKDYKIGIFLINWIDPSLEMYIVDDNEKEIRPKIKLYNLILDKYLLNFIKTYANKIDYIIFNGFKLEVIKTSEIENLLKSLEDIQEVILPRDLMIRGKTEKL